MANMKDYRSWAQGFICYKQLRDMVDMNNSWSWTQVSKCYKQLKVVDDMNDFGLRAQASRYYERLKAIVDPQFYPLTLVCILGVLPTPDLCMSRPWGPCWA